MTKLSTVTGIVLNYESMKCFYLSCNSKVDEYKMLLLQAFIQDLKKTWKSNKIYRVLVFKQVVINLMYYLICSFLYFAIC